MTATGRRRWSGYHTYLALADRDTDAIRAQTLRHLAAAELEHAALWAQRIVELGGKQLPVYSGNPHGAARLPRLPAPEAKSWLFAALRSTRAATIASYGTQLKELGDEGSIKPSSSTSSKTKSSIIVNLGAAPLRGRLTRRARQQQTRRRPPKAYSKSYSARRNHGRPGSGSRAGSWIGDAIYGVNDGLQEPFFGIVSGVSGATAGDGKYVLLAGLVPA